jgi:hypothetical protein
MCGLAKIEPRHEMRTPKKPEIQILINKYNILKRNPQIQGVVGVLFLQGNGEHCSSIITHKYHGRTNIVRNAQALGINRVLLKPKKRNPLNAKAYRG